MGSRLHCVDPACVQLACFCKHLKVSFGKHGVFHCILPSAVFGPRHPTLPVSALVAGSDAPSIPCCWRQEQHALLLQNRVSDPPVGHSDVLLCNCTYGGKKQLNSIAAILATCDSTSCYGGGKDGLFVREQTDLAIGALVHPGEDGRDY